MSKSSLVKVSRVMGPVSIGLHECINSVMGLVNLGIIRDLPF